MTVDNPLQALNESAAEYDRITREYGYYSPDILFGLCFDYIRSGERLLDIGIGTGLSAFPFAKAGLIVAGMDISREMLNTVRLKDIAVDLKQFDIRNQPWPYPDGYFDHLIACGVLHFFADLAPLLLEASRIIRPRGTFAFTTKAPQQETDSSDSKIYTESVCGVTVFLHNVAYINATTEGRGFTILKHLRYSDVVDETERRDSYDAWVIRKAEVSITNRLP